MLPFILPSPERLIPHSMVAALGNLSFPPTDWNRKLKPTKIMFMTHYAGVLFTEKMKQTETPPKSKEMVFAI